MVGFTKVMTDIPSLPDVQRVLALAEKLPEATKVERRHLLRRLATSIEIDGPAQSGCVTPRNGQKHSRYSVQPRLLAA
jgi:hypothetical protein